MLNCVVVWNTRYLEAAADQLSRAGTPVPDEAWQHLSPLLWNHLHLVGTYSFEDPVIEGQLRPLRSIEEIRTPLLSFGRLE